MEKTIEELKAFIQENILSGEIDLNANSSLKDLGVDSFSIVEIVLFVERKYNKLIPDHLMVPETFLTLEHLAEVIESLEE